MELNILVYYTIKEGLTEKFLEKTAPILKEVRREEGCLRYDYFLSTDRPREVLLVEKWASKELQKAHMKHPNMDRIKALKDEFVSDTKAEFLED